MYKIELLASGYILTFAGIIGKEEMLAWADESKRRLEKAPSTFGVIIDMRDLSPLPPEAQKIMVVTQALYKEKGMQRSAVILNNKATAEQFMRLAHESGIYAFERYLDASATSDWGKVAVAWVKEGIDPDA